jgi:hypothetical protein
MTLHNTIYTSKKLAHPIGKKKNVEASVCLPLLPNKYEIEIEWLENREICLGESNEVVSRDWWCVEVEIDRDLG